MIVAVPSPAGLVLLSLAYPALACGANECRRWRDSAVFTLCLSILTRNLLKQCASVAVGFFVWGQDDGGGYSVAGFHVE